MHETSLVEFTLNAVEKKAQEIGFQKVSVIRIVIGDMRGALPDLMEQAFRLLKRRRPLFQDCRLEMAQISVKLRCAYCGTAYEPDDFHQVACPACRCRSYDVITGNELFIADFEGE
jgi:hydrogenase nickel insertion protein HypA